MAAAAPLPRPSGLPSPRSPTLSEISMILPNSEPLRSVSPGPFAQRPPSPSSLYAHTNRSQHTIKLDTAPSGRRSSPQTRSPPLSSQSSHSTLRNMNSSDASATSPLAYDDTLASSPTVRDSLFHPQGAAASDSPPQRRLSTTSSLNSDDLETIRNRWPGFDSQGFDDSGVDLEEEEGQGPFPAATTDKEPENTPLQSGHSDEEEDGYSSDLYSKRAEMILANAKKRLNVMEGNLRGARQSLVVSPTFNNSKTTSELQHQISAARERDRRLYAGMGPIPPRNRSYQSSPLSSTGSPVHSRGMSETSVPLPFSSPTYMAKPQQSKRASSAMGHGSGPWSLEGYGNGRFPIKESRSFEIMRDPRGQEDGDYSLRAHSRGSRSPPNVLETLPEDYESPQLHRSASTTSSLRDQVNDLKGRISSLRLKTQEDSMRRRSIQNLRAPSPFTSAETWYSGTDAYKTPGSPINADAGVGLKLESPTRKALYEEEASDSTTQRYNAAPHTDHAYAVKEVNRDLEHSTTDHDETHVPDQSGHWKEPKSDEADSRTAGLGLDLVDESDSDFQSVEGDELELCSSIYEDAVYEMPATGRHEDRIDAFDYENFFLHSAMGTYSAARPGSSGSSSSVDSVATTRPVTTNLHTRNVSSGSAKRVSMHARNSSVASVSTIASFATAAEEQSDDEEENPQMDQFSQHLFSDQQPAAQNAAAQNSTTSPRSDSAVNIRKPNSSPSLSSTISRVSSPGSGDIVTGLQTSKIFSTLLESPRDAPQLALNEEETQLIYSLAASFQQVCTNLKSTSGDQYERKEWRRRLDEARRILNGEEFEGQPF